jgi:pimeloyl-ACP methyl ester carboxylesterase
MRILTLALVLAAAPAMARTVGTVDFVPCELESIAGSGRIKAECARLEVPENPAAPAGRKVVLQVAWVAARVSRAEPDPVVFLAGGPGQSAVESFPDVAAAFEPLRKRRHILLIDQRGTGRSSPLKCPLPDWKDPANSKPAAVRRQTAECLAQLGARADPRFYTTSDAVRDLEAVRLALGSPRLNLVGISYGTRVALEYLRRYPDGVRTLVLDGVVPPELALAQEHAANLDEALHQMFSACRLDATCFKRFGDPERTLALLRQRLRARPEPTTIHDPRTHALRHELLTDELLAGVLRLYAYQPEATALLPLLLDEAANGRPQALVSQGELIFQRLGESIAHGMELSVVCAEDEPFLATRPRDERTLLGGALVELTREQCAVWPRGTRPADFKQPVASDKPVLLLSGERDPVTPPRYADVVARSLSRARHLVLAGQGHGVMGRGCLPRIVRAFVAGADPATPDVACLKSSTAPPAFTSYQGPEP